MQADASRNSVSWRDRSASISGTSSPDASDCAASITRSAGSSCSGCRGCRNDRPGVGGQGASRSGIAAGFRLRLRIPLLGDRDPDGGVGLSAPAYAERDMFALLESGTPRRLRAIVTGLEEPDFSQLARLHQLGDEGIPDVVLRLAELISHGWSGATSWAD